jgi:hypothetical protein
MAEQSHRQEMSAAIRAQRERHAVPRTIAPEPLAAPAPHPEPEPEAEPEVRKRRKSLVERLRGK